jgi:TonB family protein
MESQLMFAPLATPQSRWKSFLIGWGFQVQLVLAFLVLNVVLPKQIQEAKKVMVVNLVAPVEHVITEAQPVNQGLAAKPALQPFIETPKVAKLVVTRQVREISEPDAKVPEIKLTSQAPNLPRLPNAPIAKVVATNTFATPTNLMPTTTKPAAQVQTGAFGDPSGIPATGDGKHGEPGSPVEIIEKPKPSYTEEGRKRGVEGEVRLAVQFTADGHVRVLRVLQGLGFGLDEQALHCAEHIRFKPATHGGQPIDSTAVVHIVFELVS